MRYQIKIAVDDGYLFTVRAERRQRLRQAGQRAPDGLVSRADQVRGPRRPGPTTSARSACSTARPITSVNWKTTSTRRSRPAQLSPSTGGWLGFTDKYWLTALVPDSGSVAGAASAQSPSGGLPGRLSRSRRRPSRRARRSRRRPRLFAGAKEKALARPLRGRRHHQALPSRSTGAGSNGSCGRSSTC